MSFGCFYLVGTVFLNSVICQSGEASEPSFSNGIEPTADWWCAHGHVVEVNKCWYGFCGDAVSLMHSIELIS